MNEIMQKYINMLSNSANIIDGIDPELIISDELKQKLIDSNKGFDVIVGEDLDVLDRSIVSEIANIPTLNVDRYKGLSTFTRIPMIVSNDYSLNRFIRCNNDKHLLITQIDGLNTSLIIYELDEINGKLKTIFKLGPITDDDDERALNGVQQFDIIWDHRESAYRVFWVNQADNKIRSALLVNGEYYKIEIISNNVKERVGGLAAAINSLGDMIVFTNGYDPENFTIGTVITKERTLTGWQTSDLIAKNGKYHDTLAAGRVQVINDEFFTAYTNDFDRIYIARVKNINNELITTTSVKTGVKSGAMQIQKYSIINNSIPANYLVLTCSALPPFLIKVEIDLSYVVMSKLEAVPAGQPNIILTNGDVIMKNKFTKNQGEQWIESHIGNELATYATESNKLALISRGDRNFYILKLDSILDYTKPITSR